MVTEIFFAVVLLVSWLGLAAALRARHHLQDDLRAAHHPAPPDHPAPRELPAQRDPSEDRTAELQTAKERLEREVIERQRAEMALRRSEEQFRAAFDALGDWINVVGPDLRIVMANEAFRQATRDYGLASNPVGCTPLELFPFLPAHVHEEYRQVFATGQPLVTLEITRAGSVEMATETRKVPIVEDGVVTQVITIIRDVTESRHTESALKASEARLRSFVEQVHDGVTIIGKRGIVIEWNHAQEEITGLARDEVIGQPMWDVMSRITPAGPLDPALPEPARQSVQRYLTGDAGVDTLHFDENVIQRPDKTLRVVQLTLFPLNTDEGRLAAAVTHDITERKYAEETLRIAEERHRAMLNSVPDLMFRLNRAGKFLDYYAPRAEDLLVPPEQFLGKTVLEVLPPDAAQALMAGIEAAQHSDRVQTVRYALVVGGEQRHFEARFAISGDDEVLAIVRNVTEAARSEERALQLRLEKERSAILAGFIQDVSHEFANPLSVIKNDLYLITYGTDPGQRQHRLDSVGGQIFHIERLVKGLLTMIHLDRSADLEYAMLDLNSLVSTILDGLTSAVQARNHTVTLHLAPAFPQVCADQRYLYQALTEVLRNAVIFTPPGGRITLSTTQQENWAVVEVRDTGIGISASDLPQVFTRFFRVDKARGERGAGLGLSIAQKIVEQHGGRIEAESTPGVGSTFRVFLPIQPA